MRTSTTVLTLIGLAAGITASAVAPSSAADAPAGAANGCYLVLPASHQDDGSGAKQTSSIDVDNPASVTLASDCAGAPVSVEDILTIETAGPNGVRGVVAQNFAADHCTRATLPPIDVTGQFKSGTYSVTVATVKDWNCTGATDNPNIYLIVTPRA